MGACQGPVPAHSARTTPTAGRAWRNRLLRFSLSRIGRHWPSPPKQAPLVPKLQLGNPHLPANRYEPLGSPSLYRSRPKTTLSAKRKRGRQVLSSLALRASVRCVKLDRERYSLRTRLGEKPGPTNVHPDYSWETVAGRAACLFSQATGWKPVLRLS